MGLRVWDASEIESFPAGLSFFDPYLHYYVIQTLEIGGEAYVSRDSTGSLSGLFIYDESERTGTVFTRSREVFDHFYGLKPFGFIFAEIRTELQCEAYDIFTVDLGNLAIDHRFNHEISIGDEGGLDEIEQFMASTHPGMNRRWVKVAVKAGEVCFTVRMEDQIAGLGWLSLVNKIGRLHSIFVKPQFRKLGIGEDILYARLLWLKSKRADSAFSEISRDNSASSRIAAKGHMKVSGQVFQYFKNDPRRGAQSERLGGCG